MGALNVIVCGCCGRTLKRAMKTHIDVAKGDERARRIAKCGFGWVRDRRVQEQVVFHWACRTCQ